MVKIKDIFLLSNNEGTFEEEIEFVLANSGHKIKRRLHKLKIDSVYTTCDNKILFDGLLYKNLCPISLNKIEPKIFLEKFNIKSLKFKNEFIQFFHKFTI